MKTREKCERKLSVGERSRQKSSRMWGGGEGEAEDKGGEHFCSALVQCGERCSLCLNRWLLSSLSRRRLSDVNELQRFEDRNSGHLASMM